MNLFGLLHQFPLQALLGVLVPLMQFSGSRLAAMRSVHRKRRLREEILALDAFISSREKLPAESTGIEVLEDALRERGTTLNQLAAAAEPKRLHRMNALHGLRRLLLLYPPRRPSGWLLRWAFFYLLIATLTGLIRGIAHVNYLRMPILVPLLAATSSLCVLVRLAALRMDGSHTQSFRLKA